MVKSPQNVRHLATAEVFLETPRLILRQWREEDIENYAALNSDETVMAYFPSVLTREQSLAHLQRMTDAIASNRYGLFAAEHKTDRKLIGFTGLSQPSFEAAFTPCTEIGWRLAKEYWNCGYASEAATACLAFAFEQLKLEEVVSFTAVQNTRSEAVMKKIGMSFAGIFEHPLLPEGHILRRHILYRIKANRK